jgi:hypothetical protein
MFFCAFGKFHLFGFRLVLGGFRRFGFLSDLVLVSHRFAQIVFTDLHRRRADYQAFESSNLLCSGFLFIGNTRTQHLPM